MKIIYTSIIIAAYTVTTFCQNFWEPLGLNDWWWIQSLAISSENHIFVGTSYDGVFHSTDNGQNWDQINNGLQNKDIRSILTTPTNSIFIGTNGQGVYRSTNDGVDWVQINNGLTTQYSKYVYGFAYDGGNSLYAITFDAVYKTVDYGDSWSLTGIGITKNDLRAITIDSSGVIYVASYWGKVFRSTNLGQTWADKSNGMTANFCYSITVNTNGYVFLGTDKGVYTSIDKAENWVRVSNGIEIGKTVSCLIINSLNHIYAGTFNGGIYRSIDDAQNWVQVNNGLTNMIIKALAKNSDNYIYVGVYGNGGIFRSINPTSSIIDNERPRSGFLLKQNYPNPFNPTTNIQYAISNRQFVMIKVYDVLGNEIETLVDEEKLPGNYEVEFDASKLSSGTYFYRMKAGDFSKTKKFVLLK